MKRIVTIIIFLIIFISAKAQINWEDVEIANFESDVTDLVKLDMVTSKAKGVTVYSSQGKMQTRAINKIKMMTAMLGGSTVLIIDQQSQSAQSGYFVSTTAGANISGVAFTDQLVEVDDIIEGVYLPTSQYILKTNDKSIAPETLQNRYQVTLEKDVLVQKKDGVQANITYKFSNKYSLNKWNIAKIENDIIYLSGVHRTTGGKETYLTVLLKKM